MIDGEGGNRSVAAHDGAGARAAELAHRLASDAGRSAERKHGVTRHGESARADDSRCAQREGAGGDIGVARERAGRVEREHASAGLGQSAYAGAE